MNKFLYISILFMVSCSDVKEPEKEPEIKWTTDQSLKLGKELALEEELAIQVYLEGAKKFKYTLTGSGLRYSIYERSEDTTVKPAVGNQVCVDLRIDQLDGTNCYQTDADECMQFLVDKSEAESGLQEAIKLLSIGDRARLIIPSHIAHGLIGDQDMIPPLSTLVIDVKLIEINE